jgi:hypothetical protein
MAIEWVGFFSEGVRKILFEAFPRWISDRFAYRLELEAQLRNQQPRIGEKGLERPIISIFVKIRNAGTKDEFVHQCGFDGLYVGSPCATAAEWKQPTKLEARSFIECELRFSQTHDPIIKSVWVENALKKKWYLPSKRLKKLNVQLQSVLERNRETQEKLESK